MKLITDTQVTLHDLLGSIQQIAPEEYCKPCVELSGSTIGEHTRHIIELFQCLLNQYETGVINYDKRERNKLIENNPEVAMACLNEITIQIKKENKTLTLESDAGVFQTNYFRELLYNLEHCIHHQALIKVALVVFNSLVVSDNFGVAPSTIKYRKQCVQ
ncbi:MAG: DinB family protein [Bacteroidetes bacterium]|nr:DinB family protein [Bacteroidota bacterium]